jgi:cytochrome c-type biogenesis protein CcmE
VKRTRVLVALAVIVAALGVVAWKGLSGNLVYYQTPTELLSKGPAAVGERARLGGLRPTGRSMPTPSS